MPLVLNPNLCICNNNPTDCTTTDDCDICSECKGCFIAGHPVLNSNGSVPCNDSGVFNIAPFVCNDVCDGSVKYTVIKADNVFLSAVIDSAGILSYTFSSQAVPGKYYEIIYKVTCEDSCSSLKYGSFGSITIGVKNLCKDKCGRNEKCDPCTGNCSSNVDLSTYIN